jgi:two-component system response regulator AtoC
LFYRLNAVSIVLPPLRERREDIPPLAQTFANRVYSLSPTVRFSGDALTLLQQYSWPGNIRELENAVVRAAAMCDGIIRVPDLPERVRNHRDQAVAETAQDLLAKGDSDSATAPEEWPPLSEIEGRYVARVLAHTGGNKQAASRMLDVDRKTLGRMIERHQITFDRRSAAESHSLALKTEAGEPELARVK